MKHYPFNLLIVVLMCFACSKNHPTAMNKIIPTPQKLVEQKKSAAFEFDKETSFFAPNYQDINLVIDYVNERFSKATNLKILQVKNTDDARIKVIEYKGVSNPEAYKLEISKDEVKIYANNAKAVFYAFQSIFSLLPTELDGNKFSEDLLLPSVHIEDAPVLKYRGMHLDISRHFMPVKFIKEYIDFIARYKMNTFHWHLTDDQGWRIEIKKYPRLTEVGAWRDSTVIGHAAKPRGYKKERHGGFYTQEDVKEVVRYAKSRFVTVIPEIELPGHSRAAIKAYPYLSCTGIETPVASTWGVFDEVYCAGKETSFEFLQGVLDEVIELFPCEYIHIGGDECPKASWKKCPLCQKRIKKHKLKDEYQLQAYFVQRMEKYLNSKGKKIIGWNEILEGGIAPSATIMAWTGEKSGIEAAKDKHEVIITPNPVAYLDHYQDDIAKEPLSIGGYTTVQEIFEYNPIPKELTQEERKYVIGFQGNVWTEYMPTSKQIEYMVFPRMAAIAETAWRADQKADFNEYKIALERELTRYKVMGIEHAKVTTNEKFEEISKKNGYWYNHEDKSMDHLPLNPAKK